jgi:hypothetical protein
VAPNRPEFTLANGCVVTAKKSESRVAGLQPKIMKEMSQLRAQLAGLIKMYFPDLSESLGTSGCCKPPNAVQESLLRQIILAGLVDRVARKDPEQKGQRVR